MATRYKITGGLIHLPDCPGADAIDGAGGWVDSVAYGRSLGYAPCEGCNPDGAPQEAAEEERERQGDPVPETPQFETGRVAGSVGPDGAGTGEGPAADAIREQNAEAAAEREVEGETGEPPSTPATPGPEVPPIVEEPAPFGEPVTGAEEPNPAPADLGVKAPADEDASLGEPDSGRSGRSRR
jgi:hypothetical protein